jgi:hypothetical protein
MPQDPLLVDQIQIEPGSGDTLLIRRATDGSLEFVDAVVTGGITLQALAGLSVGGIKIVGKTGAGAEFPTIQAALDCIPATSSSTEPYVVLVGPGVYQETINIVRDWVHIIGLGGAQLEPVEPTANGAGAYHTVVIHEDLGTIPKHVVLRNLTIRNNHDNFACVRISGGAGSEVGAEDIVLDNCNLQAVAPGGNRPVWASSAEHVVVQGGSFDLSNALSLTLVEECASFTMSGTTEVTGLQLDYDSGGTLPASVGSLYTVSGCPDVGISSTLAPAVSSTLTGAGEFNILNCGRAGDVTLGGDRSFEIVGTDLGDLTLNDTVSVKLVGSSLDSVTAAGGTTLDTPLRSGTVTFTASATEAVAVSPAYPDASFTVVLELGGSSSGEAPWITGKSASGFNINFDSAQTMIVGWTATRTA